MPVRTYSSHMCTHPFFRDVRRRERRFLCPGGARAHAARFIAHLTHMHTPHTPHQKDDPRTPPHDHALNNPTDQLSAGASSAISHKNGLGDSKFVYARHEITHAVLSHTVLSLGQRKPKAAQIRSTGGNRSYTCPAICLISRRYAAERARSHSGKGSSAPWLPSRPS